MTNESNILEIKGLQTYVYTPRGIIRAVDGVSFSIPKGKVLGLVGETGCGKTLTALSIMRLIQPPIKTVGGSVILDGNDLLVVPEDEMHNIRGRDVSIIFQQARTALNPVRTVGSGITEAIRAHREVTDQEANAEAAEMLKRVGLPDPSLTMKRYPFQLSGGMAQRIVIAIALVLKPKLLIADEPTSALDVTIQAQILDLIRELVHETGTSVLFITHDLGVAGELCDQLAVMYAGKIVEQGEKNAFFKAPKHPYTEALLRAIPTRRKKGYLQQIVGEVPDLMHPPQGCRFHPRCPQVMQVCLTTEPELLPLRLASTVDSKVACHLYDTSEKKQ